MFQTEIFFDGSETKGNRYHYFISCTNKNLLPSFVPLLKKYLLSIRDSAGTGIIYRTQTRTNKFLNVVCLFVFKMSICLTFIMKKWQKSDKHCKLVI